MSYISDKIAEARAAGHVVPEVIEEIFLALEEEVGLKDKQPKQDPNPNPLDGERLDT